VLGRRRRDGKYSPQKKFNTGLRGNESNKTMISNTKEPSSAQEEILHKITENFMEKILERVNKMYKMHSRNFKTSKINNMRRYRNK
jgi:hypothetical protein